jgi:hypothetical protein
VKRVVARAKADKGRSHVRFPRQPPRISAGNEPSATGPVLAIPDDVASKLNRPTTRLEVLVGRSLAMCVHPYAAWRAQSTAGRWLVVFAYLAASYAVTLTVLLISF